MIEEKIFQAFVITMISEMWVVLAIQNFVNWKKLLVGVIIINCVTHPMAIFALHILNWPYFLIEGVVAAMEIIWYLKIFHLSWKKAGIISILANAFSILIGYLGRTIV